MTGTVNLKRSTVGEFDLEVSLWLVNPDDPDDEIDAIMDFHGEDAVEQAKRWAEHEGYQIGGGDMYEYAGFLFEVVSTDPLDLRACPGQHPAAYKDKHRRNAMDCYRQEHR